MGFKGPMPPNTLRVSNIGEGVSQEDLDRLFSNFGRLERIKFKSSTCALVKFVNFYHAREALENLQDTILEGRELTIVWNKKQTPSISSKLWITIDGPFLDDQKLNDLFSLYGVISHPEFARHNGKTRGVVSFELDRAADSAMCDLNGTTLYGRKFHVAKFARNMGDVVAALDHTPAQKTINVTRVYKFEGIGMEIQFVAFIEMDSIRTVADFLLVLHDLWVGSPLAAGLSLNCPWPGYHVSRDNTVGIVTGVNFNHTSMIKHDDQSGDSMSYFRAIWGWDDSHVFIGNMERGVDVTSLTLEKTIFTLQSPHTCQLFHADLMHTLQLLACLREPLVWAGLYVDIGLATSVSFCET